MSGDPIKLAREAFLSLIADAHKWEEQVDGDCDSEGRPTMTVDYVIETSHSQLQELCDALGFPKPGYNETLKDVIDAAVACTCQGGFVQAEGPKLRANDCPVHGHEERS